MTTRYRRFSDVHVQHLLHQQLNKLSDDLNNNQDGINTALDGHTSAIVDLQSASETQAAQIQQIMDALGTLGAELSPVIAKVTKKKG